MKKDQQQKPAKNIDEYLAAVPEMVQPVLKKLRKTIRSAAPQAEEVISYQIPTYKYHGPLVHFAAFRNHCSFYVVSKPIMEAFTSELKPWDTSGTTIHFSAKNPLPASLVKKIVKARIEENETRVKKQDPPDTIHRDNPNRQLQFIESLHPDQSGHLRLRSVFPKALHRLK